MDRENLKQRLELYIQGVQEMVKANWEEYKFTYAPVPKVEIEEGNRYIRVKVNEYDFAGVKKRSQIHTFIDRTNGDILKAATWKAPQKNGVRGNIFNEEPTTGVNYFGAIYLR